MSCFQGGRETEETMANETVRLAEYAAGLRYENIPADVAQNLENEAELASVGA